MYIYGFVIFLAPLPPLSLLKKGKYENIRVFHLDHNPVGYGGVDWVINSSVVLANWTVADANIVANGGKGNQCGLGRGHSCTTLDQFSAACFYYAQALTDRMVAEAAETGDADAVVPLGMIESAYVGRKSPSATKNLLEVTDGPSKGATQSISDLSTR